MEFVQFFDDIFRFRLQILGKNIVGIYGLGSEDLPEDLVLLFETLDLIILEPDFIILATVVLFELTYLLEQFIHGFGIVFPGVRLLRDFIFGHGRFCPLMRDWSRISIPYI